MAHTLIQYASGYQNLFDTVKIKTGYTGIIDSVVSKINKGKIRYEAMQQKTGVPWFFIGVIHYMEAGCDFTKHMHNGDPLSRRTVQVPAGRPKAPLYPPFTWEQSAFDALQYEGLTTVKDWSLPQMLYLFEKYNGFGYRNKGINSPYLWSMSNHYTQGKYVADGRYDPNAVSKQAGAAIILYRVMEKNNILTKYLKTAAGGAALLAIVAAFFF